jgi:hypothetical protein
VLAKGILFCHTLQGVRACKKATLNSSLPNPLDVAQGFVVNKYKKKKGKSPLFQQV